MCSAVGRATEAASEFSSLRASAEEAQRLFESKEAACAFFPASAPLGPAIAQAPSAPPRALRRDCPREVQQPARPSGYRKTKPFRHAMCYPVIANMI
jgi:hypothetical protein